MEATVAKADLLGELALCQGVAARKETIPILTHVLMRAEPGRIVLSVTDLEATLRTVCQARVEQAGVVTLPARRLHELVKELPDGEVRFALDGNGVKVTAGGYAARLPALDPQDFPTLPDQVGAALAIPCDALRAMVRRASSAADDSMGVLLARHAAEWRLVATDGHRLAEACHLSNGGPSEPIVAVLGQRALVEFGRIADHEGDAEIFLDSDRVFVVVGDRVLAMRRIDKTFPAYERIIPKGGDAPYLEVAREALATAVRRVGMVGDWHHAGAVTLTAPDGVVEIRARSVIFGEAEERIPAEGRDFKTRVRANYLSDFLEATDAETVRLEAQSAEMAVLCTLVGQDGYRYVVMPMRE